MKTLFIPAKLKAKVNEQKIEELSKKLPENIAIAYSIQYQEAAFKIKNILVKTHKITKLVQVLGCSKPTFPKQTQAILLITSGSFHALPLAAKTSFPIYILESNNLRQISEKDIESFKARQKAAYVKFLNSKSIGILVSTKPGQQNLKKALELKKQLKDKKAYTLIGDNINTQEFENFSIESWINTACPRLDMDSSVLNIDDLNLSN